MERHNLGDQLFHLVNQYSEENGLKVSRGTIGDASIINALSTTKNKEKESDPEMRQTRKGNQWYFGMKAQIGVDSRTKLIHSVVATSAYVPDSQVLPDLLHAEETRVWGYSEYSGKTQAIADHAPRAKDFTHAKGSRNRKLTGEERASNRNKSRVRAKVEHQFGITNRQFGFPKVRYRGLNKNALRLFVSCALSNVLIAKRTLLRRSQPDLQASFA
jgi:IS5 family transposase